MSRYSRRRYSSGRRLSFRDRRLVNNVMRFMDAEGEDQARKASSLIQKIAGWINKHLAEYPTLKKVLVILLKIDSWCAGISSAYNVGAAAWNARLIYVNRANKEIQAQIKAQGGVAANVLMPLVYAALNAATAAIKWKLAKAIEEEKAE